MERYESPSKKQKFGHESTPDIMNSPFDSDNDNHETVETVPLPRPGQIGQPSQVLTQPTQVLQRPQYDGQNGDVVQVAASSSPPPAAQVIQARPGKPGGLLASAMAPPGTSFRTPFGMRPAPRPAFNPITVSSDDEDDGPTYRGGSSDEERVQRLNDIKPTKFGRAEERVEESPAKKDGMSRFQQITSSSVYKPGMARPSGGAGFAGSAFDSRNRGNGVTTSTHVAARRPGPDIMANAYGSASKKSRQLAPSRAQPVVTDDDETMRVSDIQDWGARQKVKHIRDILPTKSVSACYKALVANHMNTDDAMDYLANEEEAAAKQSSVSDKGHTVDLTGSDDELMPTPVASKVKAIPLTQSRSIQEKWSKKTQTIQEKWSSTQTAKPHTIQDQVQEPSPPPKKQFKRLVRGRKHPSSPNAEPSPEPKRGAKDESDSDEVVSEEEYEAVDESFDARLLKIFNSYTAGDLCDIASIDKETAEYLLSKRPFKSLEYVRQVPSKTAKTAKSRTKPKPIGEKIVDKCHDMLVGYDAVDDLVTKCENLGKPVASEMKEWGVDVFGAKDAEVEIVSLGESQPSAHDSGIGTPQSDLGNDDIIGSRKSKFISPPALMNKQYKMKDYQVVGINWLSLLYRQGLSCILADDMGLGKTCQVIAFLAHLLEIGEKGPHLVVVPASTIENWLMEFQKFCPALAVEPLYGTDKERFGIRDRLEVERDNVNVIVTTQHIAKAKEDAPWLRHYGFTCTVYDEAHFLRNSKSQVYEKLMRIRSKFRLLLTGTPLQNNLQELMSLLGFILPAVFQQKKEDLEIIFSHKAKTSEENHEALLSAERIARARSMLTPFILRRKKHQVLKDIPKKTSRVEYCDMSAAQIELYTKWQEKARRIMNERANGNPPVNESANVLMKLRQAAISELLFHRLYDDPKLLKRIAKKCLKDPLWSESNPDLIFTEICEYSDFELHKLCSEHPAIQEFELQDEPWMDSGKVIKMIELLMRFREEGSRTLLFSQFVMVLDILQLVMQSLDIDYLRLDGSTPVNERQDMIDQFNNEDIPVFMLSTKAGGAGINLAAANKIIIFDSSFNPQDDIQAENRAHRIGQTREVEVVRLVSRGTIEEQIHALGLTKLALDQRVAGEDSNENEQLGIKEVGDMFFDKLKRDKEEEKPELEKEVKDEETTKKEE